MKPGNSSDKRARPRPPSNSSFSWGGNRMLDPKFRRNVPRYLTQCVMATVVIFSILVFLNIFTQTVLIAALGATTFIAFTMPHVNSARPRYLVGGYTMGIIAGVLFSLLVMAIEAGIEGDPPRILFMAGAALATGLAIFLMVLTDTEHPPAAGLALGFVLNPWDLKTVIVVLLGVAVISLIKESSKKQMIDLL